LGYPGKDLVKVVVRDELGDRNAKMKGLSPEHHRVEILEGAVTGLPMNEVIHPTLDHKRVGSLDGIFEAFGDLARLLRVHTVISKDKVRVSVLCPVHPLAAFVG
jgi:hypothetical protein